MTVQEAIEKLDRKLCHEKEPHKFCRDACMYGEECCEVQVAKKCMEKQIPKKPIFVDVRFRHHGKHISDGQSLDKCYKCPNCNTHIFHVWDDEKYCKCCGQALDWSEEDD